MIKYWCAKVEWWHGDLAKPRSNMKVRSRMIKRKTIKELAERLAHARFKRMTLVETPDSHPVTAYMMRLLEDKIIELQEVKRGRSKDQG